MLSPQKREEDMTTRVLFLAALLSGCDGGAVTPGVLSLCAAGTPHDPVTIDDASISGDQLTVSLSFGGGCEAHDLGLCWDGSIAESSPPQVFLTVAHDANNDLCEAYLSEPLIVDISALQGAGSTVTVNLDGWEEALTYTW